MMSNKLFVLFFSLISCHVGQSQNVPGLAIERVREDIKHSSEEEIPEDLDELADRPIEIFTAVHKNKGVWDWIFRKEKRSAILQ